ncbi:MAG: FKBP-type peptidyl-prolyl cis-trans isomerase [Muribaculaceae bacterium]|nr:FKBP-type peptidyl-prolyl cis-trans isomerase [Muribaculaceae bacterium]
MKRSIIYMLIGAATLGFASCGSDDDSDVWDQYADYREANDAFMAEQEALTGADGKAVYTRVVPAWNKNAYVLMRWFNDTTKTQDNLRPLYTSTVDVKYYGRTYENEPFDSSYLSLTPADSVVRFQLNSVISGWAIAMERMHVGDTVEVLVPYPQGYGSSSQGTKIKPYSALKFNIKLVDIPGEYIRP